MDRRTRRNLEEFSLHATQGHGLRHQHRPELGTTKLHGKEKGEGEVAKCSLESLYTSGGGKSQVLLCYDEPYTAACRRRFAERS